MDSFCFMNVNFPKGAIGLVSLKICMVYHERLVQLHPLSALVQVKAQNKEEMYGFIIPSLMESNTIILRWKFWLLTLSMLTQVHTTKVSKLQVCPIQHTYPCMSYRQEQQQTWRMGYFVCKNFSSQLRFFQFPNHTAEFPNQPTFWQPRWSGLAFKTIVRKESYTYVVTTQ